MSMETTIGSEYNLLEPTPRSARQIKLASPILKNAELDKLRRLDGSGPHGFNSTTLPMLFAVQDEAAGLEKAMTDLCRQASAAVETFGAIAVKKGVFARYFPWTASRVSGVGLDVIAAEGRARHEHAFPERPLNGPPLDAGGHYQYRREGEYHLFNPETIHKLQYACRSGDFKVFKEYSALVNTPAKRLCTLRGLFELKAAEQPIPIEEVASVE